MIDDAGKLAILVAISVGLFVSGYGIGDNIATGRCNAASLARVNAESAAVQSAIKANEAIATKQQVDSQKIKKGYDNEIAKIRADAATAGRLRLPASVCGESASGTKATGASDSGTTGSRLLPEAIDRDLRGLMLEADEVVAGCRAAKEFIIANGLF